MNNGANSISHLAHVGFFEARKNARAAPKKEHIGRHIGRHIGSHGCPRWVAVTKKGACVMSPVMSSMMSPPRGPDFKDFLDVLGCGSDPTDVSFDM